MASVSLRVSDKAESSADCAFLVPTPHPRFLPIALSSTSYLRLSYSAVNPYIGRTTDDRLHLLLLTTPPVAGPRCASYSNPWIVNESHNLILATRDNCTLIDSCLLSVLVNSLYTRPSSSEIQSLSLRSSSALSPFPSDLTSPRPLSGTTTTAA